MKKLLTRLSVISIFILIISFICMGCGVKPQKGAKQNADVQNHGIEKLKGFSPIPLSVLKKSGLGVYGSGKVKVGENTMIAEIDSKDLTKVKEGYSAKIVNAKNKIMLSGKVKSPVDVKNIKNGDSCDIEIVLDEETNKSKPANEGTENKSKNIQNGNSSMTTSVATSEGSGRITSDSYVEVTINLPAKGSGWYIQDSCIKDGNDGKKYIWVSKKKQMDIKSSDDFELKEVKLGETDGRKTQILSGLEDYESIALEI